MSDALPPPPDKGNQMADTVKRRGIVQVSLAMLGDLLALPPGHEVVLVRQSPNLDDVAELMISGPKMSEVCPGMAVERWTLVRYRDREHAEFVR